MKIERNLTAKIVFAIIMAIIYSAIVSAICYSTSDVDLQKIYILFTCATLWMVGWVAVSGFNMRISLFSPLIALAIGFIVMVFFKLFQMELEEPGIFVITSILLIFMIIPFLKNSTFFCSTRNWKKIKRIDDIKNSTDYEKRVLEIIKSRFSTEDERLKVVRALLTVGECILKHDETTTIITAHKKNITIRRAKSNEEEIEI